MRISASPKQYCGKIKNAYFRYPLASAISCRYDNKFNYKSNIYHIDCSLVYLSLLLFCWKCIELLGLVEHIEKSQNAFEMAKKRMKTGKGNLMNRFDTIKKLGPNTKRNISQAWIDQDKNKEHLSLKHDLDDKK